MGGDDDVRRRLPDRIATRLVRDRDDAANDDVEELRTLQDILVRFANTVPAAELKSFIRCLKGAGRAARDRDRSPVDWGR